MLKSFTFKGVTLQPGDTVYMEAQSVSAEPFRAAVVRLNESGNIEVVGPELAKNPFLPNAGIFSEGDVISIRLERPAREAVPLESDAPLASGQLATVQTTSGLVQATIYAAMEGMVVGYLANGHVCVGMSSYWRPVPA